MDSLEATRIVDSAWEKELSEALKAGRRNVRVICPFIKSGAVDRILAHNPHSIEIITRFNLLDFAEGVSDISALQKLLSAGAKLRGVKNLHAKLYLFGNSRAIITSANLTEAALWRNHELGVVTDDSTIIAACHVYFDRLWERGNLLTDAQLVNWSNTVLPVLATGGRPSTLNNLMDFGATVGLERAPAEFLPRIFADAPQSFVKFLGQGSDRAPLTVDILEEICSAGCHWALAYPSSRRPTGVKDGALMFIGRLTSEPADTRIFGRAIALKYLPERDDATDLEISARPWKTKWPRYIRVHHAEFVAGPMANGVSLAELMDTLGENSFASTLRNAADHKGNLNPRKAYMRHAAVELSEEGSVWLNERLQLAFTVHGKVPEDTLGKLDWPAQARQ